jgi:hypothetical protein
LPGYRLERLRLRLPDRVRLLRERLLPARLRLRLPPLRLRLLPPERLRLVDRVVPERLPPALRLRVAAAFRAALEREDFEREADALPPFLPPLREELRLVFLPRPEPLFFPPPVSLFTVAQARRAASRPETPRFS